MKRSTVARIISVVLLGYCLAFVITRSSQQSLERYRSLSHEALLAEVTKTHTVGFDGMFLFCILMVAVLVAAGNTLTTLVAASIDRISPPLPSSADHLADSSGESSHVH